MNFSGKNIIAGFVLILVLVVSVFLVYDLLKKPALKPIQVVPVDAQVFAVSNHPEKLLDTWSVSPIFNKDNKKVREIGAVWKLLDSLIQNNPRFEEKLSFTRVGISLHALEGNRTGVLAGVSEENGFEVSHLKNFLSKEYKEECAVSRTEDDEKIFALVFSKFEPVLYLSDIQGVVLLSFEKELIKKAHSHVKSKEASISTQKGFKKVQASTRAKSDASIYINYSQLFKLPKAYSSDRYKDEIELFKSFASWSELDLTAKPNKILMSGYTYSDDSLFNYLSCVKGQKPQGVSGTSIAPKGISFFMSMSISDANAWIEQQECYQEAHNIEHQKSVKAQLQKNYGFKTKSYFTSWMGKEIFIGAGKKGVFYAYRAKDKALATSRLNELAKKAKSESFNKKHNGVSLRKINIDNLLYPTLGSIAEADPYYYSTVGDFVVFSTNQASLKQVIDSHKSGRVLSKSSKYKKLEESFADKANITACVFNPDFLTSYMNQDFNELLLANTWITRFGGLGVQMIEKGDLTFTSLYAEYQSGASTSSIYMNPVRPKPIEKPVEENNNSTNEDTKPDPIVENNQNEESETFSVQDVDGLALAKNGFGQPFIVESHKSATDYIMTFDEGGKVYYFNNQDKLLWSLQLDGTPLSKVYEVDALRNGKVQYLFNTANKIYLLDVKGRHVAGFPVKVPSGAAGPISLFDYSNNRSYRILVGGKNKTIYNYGINGKPVKGWKNPKASTPIVGEAKHLVFNSKDHLIFPAQNGDVYITDRKGNRRIRVASIINNNPESGFWLNKTNSKGNVITSDKEGRLTYISSSGKISNTVFGVFSPDHFFFYEDFTRNGVKDFIYIDKNKLQVLDRFKKTQFEYTFQNSISVKPQIFRKGTQLILAVTDRKAGKVYFFNKNGLINANSGIPADDQVSFGTVKSGKWEVISTYGNKVIRTPWK